MAPDPGKGLRQQQAGQAGTGFHPQVVRSQASADPHTGHNREEIPEYTHRLLSCFHFSQPAAGRSHADRPAAGLFFVIHIKDTSGKDASGFRAGLSAALSCHACS